MAAVVGVIYHRPALLWLYIQFGVNYKGPDTTQLNKEQDSSSTFVL